MAGKDISFWAAVLFAAFSGVFVALYVVPAIMLASCDAELSKDERKKP